MAALTRVPEFAEMKPRRLAISGVRFLFCGKATQKMQFAVDAYARGKPTTFALRVNTLKARNGIRDTLSIPVVPRGCRGSQVLPGVVGSIIDVIDLLRVLTGHPFPDQPMRKPVLAGQTDLLMAKSVCCGCGDITCVKFVPSFPLSGVDEMVYRANAPRQFAGFRIVIQSLAQKLLRGYDACSHMLSLKSGWLEARSDASLNTPRFISGAMVAFNG